jgi:hypothetical protein
VVPWGRTLDEYRRMFALTDGDLSGGVLGCGDGPASFNAEATALGHRVLSCDPLYRFSRADIARRVGETAPRVLDELRRNAADYIWTEFAGPDDVGRARLAAMARFLADYDAGRAQGRYLGAGLPELPWPDASFGLALCSHFLFLYSDHLDADFHVRAARELCRVAREIISGRIADGAEVVVDAQDGQIVFGVKDEDGEVSFDAETIQE